MLAVRIEPPGEPVSTSVALESIAVAASFSV